MQRQQGSTAHTMGHTSMSPYPVGVSQGEQVQLAIGGSVCLALTWHNAFVPSILALTPVPLPSRSPPPTDQNQPQALLFVFFWGGAGSTPSASDGSWKAGIR